MNNENNLIDETASIKFCKIEDAYSTFSTKNNNVLDDDVAKYIFESFKNLSYKSNKTLEIYLDKSCTEEEKTKCKNTIKTYFTNDYNDYKEENLKLSVVSFIFLIVGIAFISLLIFLNRIEAPYAISIIIEIFSWVFVWEFVDVFIFTRLTNKIKMRKIKKVLDSEIVFIEGF